jgi:hypothetical protein
VLSAGACTDERHIPTGAELAKALERVCSLSEDSRLFSASMEEGASPYHGTRRAGERLQYHEDGARHRTDVRKLHPWTARGRAGTIVGTESAARAVRSR